MTLDVDAAEQALARLGDELGLSTIELAEGVCDVINAKMAQAIRTLTVEKGNRAARLRARRLRWRGTDARRLPRPSWRSAR